MPRMGNRGVDLDQGETFTLAASGARTATAVTYGTAVYFGGERQRFIVFLDVTAAATDIDDTLDVYIDFSLDNVTFYNGGHYTQVLGNGGVKSFYMVFDPSAPGTAGIAVATDAAVNTVRPAMIGPYIRARWVIVNPGGGAASFTFSVLGFAQ